MVNERWAVRSLARGDPGEIFTRLAVLVPVLAQTVGDELRRRRRFCSGAVQILRVRWQQMRVGVSSGLKRQAW